MENVIAQKSANSWQLTIYLCTRRAFEDDMLSQRYISKVTCSFQIILYSSLTIIPFETYYGFEDDVCPEHSI